ncbi:hypothetical protein ILYODFUR_017249 [Ilyodon furcidens]|uniref:Protein Flattop n=1 Tax=Ilyodon furcidens TaxID=33524 RepID=A0ABV0VH48_9TELE
MSSSFSANQYDSAFKSKRLQNWCEAKSFKERPSKHVGHTSFVADSRGHLLPGVKVGALNYFCFHFKHNVVRIILRLCVSCRKAAPGQTLRALGIYHLVSQPTTSTKLPVQQRVSVDSSRGDSANQRRANHCQTEAAGSQMLASRSAPH